VGYPLIRKNNNKCPSTRVNSGTTTKNTSKEKNCHLPRHRSSSMIPLGRWVMRERNHHYPSRHLRNHLKSTKIVRRLQTYTTLYQLECCYNRSLQTHYNISTLQTFFLNPSGVSEVQEHARGGGESQLPCKRVWSPWCARWLMLTQHKPTTITVVMSNSALLTQHSANNLLAGGPRSNILLTTPSLQCCLHLHKHFSSTSHVHHRDSTLWNVYL
jgi:hypothetical protein